MQYFILHRSMPLALLVWVPGWASVKNPTSAVSKGSPLEAFGGRRWSL